MRMRNRKIYVILKNRCFISVEVIYDLENFGD